MAGILNQFMAAPGSSTMGSSSLTVAPAQTPSVPSMTSTTPNGVKASNPYQNVSQPATTIKPAYKAPLSQASIQSASQTNPSSFNFLPGETPQAYNSRIAALVAGQGGGQTGSAGGGQIGNSGAQTNQMQPNNPPPPSTGTPVPPPPPATNQGFLGQLMQNTGNPQFTEDNQNLTDLKNQQATLENDIAKGDQPLYFKQGAMGQEQQAYQTKLAAASTQIQNDIAEQGAQTTAANAGATATLPGNQNVQVPYSNQYLNGTTGQAVNPQADQAMQSAVALETQKVQNNQEDLATAQGNLSAYGQAGLNALNQGLGPNFNANTNAGTSSAQASNANVGGTAQTSTFNGIYNGAQTSAATYSQQQSAINAVGSQALDLMQSAGINPNASQFANTKLNQLATQFSSPQYAAFNTAIQSLQARIGSALQAGEIPTAATGNAAAIANGSITLPALASTLKQVDAEMTSFVGTQQALADYAKSKIGTGSDTSSSGTSDTSSANPWH